MSHINFVIPQSRADLLSDNDVQYYVKDIIGVREIATKLKVAKQCYKDEGPEYIIDNFDVYYSILHHADSLQMDTVFKAYEDLHRAAGDFNKSLGLIFEDKESLNDELNNKYANILKMLLYVYINIVNYIDLKHDTKRRQVAGMKLKGRKKVADEDSYMCKRNDVLINLNYIMQQEINLFWDPPIVDEVFSGMVSDVCYRFLESANITSEKDTCTELFSLFGILLKSYNHGMTFVVHLVQLIKIHDHLNACVPEGIQQLVDNYNCKSLVRDFVREITEWQTDENYQDSKGTRNCSIVLSQMAVLMPVLMIPEVMYLNRYLNHESYTLRNSVLNVIVEVVLTVLTKDDLSEEDRESRDEFLEILKEHINDVSGFVRTKVFLHWGRLQTENAIPLKMQSSILEHAVTHLKDKSTTARKNAANCVTNFLTHNLYGSKLQLGAMRKELDEKNEALGIITMRLQGFQIDKIKELQADWLKHEENVKKIILERLKDDPQPSEEHDDVNLGSLPELIRVYIAQNEYNEAFSLIRIIAKTSPQYKDTINNMDPEEEMGVYLMCVRSIFLDLPAKIAEIAKAAGTNVIPTENDIKEMEALERTIDFLQDTVTFLNLIDQSIQPMKELLLSASVGDMHEAVNFFVAAYQFNIDNAVDGVLELLKLVQRSEPGRKEAVLAALKTIYLTTDSKTMAEHTTIIISRLIGLLQSISQANMHDFRLIISEWAEKGVLDNNVIDMLWQYFTGRIKVSDDESRASLALLSMVAHGRPATISRNIKLVASIGFGARGKADILLATQSCQIIAVAANEPQLITDKNPPFKIKNNDPMWTDMCEILLDGFFKDSKFFNLYIKASIDCIYRLCSKPDKIIDDLMQKILATLNENKEECQTNVLIRCCILFGEIALKSTFYLDEVVFKEMKRRAHILEERKNEQITNNNKKNKKKNTNTSHSKSFRNASNNSTNNAQNGDETIMDGAQANDAQSEFVLEILENSMKVGLSAKFAEMIANICKQSTVYDDEHLQCAATTALLRYMLVSNPFCESQMLLIFTILEKSKFESVKNIIVIHCSDLLEKCPNVVEPYTPKLYERLDDPSIDVRKTTFFMLANLILRDMIRVQGHMSEMAKCLIDQDEELKDMAKNFLTLLAQKANILYNVLPDIFSRLMESLEEEDLQTIMKYIFGLIDKNKQMENLVDRFCAKFKVTDDEKVAKNVVFCLSLINYNEKGFKKLIENFQLYKHHVLNNEVYGIFKKIINTYNKAAAKPEMKALTVELDDKIKQMFEITNGVSVPDNEFKKPKARRGRGLRKNNASSMEHDDSESSDSDECSPMNSSKQTKKSKNTRRVQRTQGKKKIVNSDSSD